MQRGISSLQSSPKKGKVCPGLFRIPSQQQEKPARWAAGKGGGCSFGGETRPAQQPPHSGPLGLAGTALGEELLGLHSLKALTTEKHSPCWVAS